MKYLFLFLTVILLVTGCKKEETEHRWTSNIDPRMRSFIFQHGSYWIFKNDSLNKTDCTYVSDVFHGYHDIGYGQNRVISYEFYEIDFVHDITQNSYGKYRTRIEGPCMFRNWKAFYPRTTGDVLYIVDTTYIYWLCPGFYQIDSLTINNEIFYDVQRCQINNITFYTALNVGLVREVITDSNNHSVVWNLLRYRTILE